MFNLKSIEMKKLIELHTIIKKDRYFDIKKLEHQCFN